MDIKKIKYAYFDLDGTLLSSVDDISDSNLAALKKLKDYGIKIGIITGRHLQVTKKHVELIQPELPIVSINGALIATPDYREIIYQCPLDNSALPFIDGLVKQRFDVTLYTSKGIAKFADSFSSYYDQLIKRYHDFLHHHRWNMFQISNLHEAEKLCIYKACLIFGNEDQKQKIMQLQSKLPPKCEFLQSSNSMVDLLCANVNKGTALKMLHGKYLDANSTIVFGDNENDVSMFGSAAFSVAMKNASKKVQDQALMTTLFPNTEDGIAHFINHYWYD